MLNIYDMHPGLNSEFHRNKQHLIVLTVIVTNFINFYSQFPQEDLI